VKFLLWVIAGFVALIVAPQFLAAGGSAVGIGIGIFLLFFIAPAIARYLIGTMLGSIVGTVILIGLVALLFGNPRACSSANLPIGDPGTVTDVARIGYLAESDFDRCLLRYIDGEAASNPRLSAAAQSCQASADVEVTRCMARVGEHWWNFDKAGSCRDEVSRTSWRTCARTALQTNSDNEGNVAFGACQGMSVSTGLMRRVAGLFSGQSDPSSSQAASPPPPPSGNYDLDCLVVNYNANNEAISKLMWEGKLPPGGCGQYTGTTALPGCLIQHLSGLGPGGVSVANSCRR